MKYNYEYEYNYDYEYFFISHNYKNEWIGSDEKTQN
tara:strand:+ start:749 stop:856 length:108 start_codon:yes stop_codon:yes gene_type:complete